MLLHFKDCRAEAGGCTFQEWRVRASCKHIEGMARYRQQSRVMICRAFIALAKVTP